MAGAFISYRRDDAAGYAGRLHESLERRLGAAQVFRDVDTLRPGQDFVNAIEEKLAACRVMLVVIGREWLNARLPSGARRLEDPYDFVRLEVAAGLARPDVLVVPTLVEGAAMPAGSELPDDMRPLARRQAVSVRDETWDADVDRLVALIGSTGPGFGQHAAAAAGWLRKPDRRVWIPVTAGLGLLVALAIATRPAIRQEDGALGGPLPPNGNTSPGAAASGAYTIDVPRVAEAAFRDLIYAVVSGNMTSRDDAAELRLRVRLSNSGRYDVNFWDGSFRLAAGTEVLAPIGGLNEVVPGHSLRYGIVTFRLPPRARKARLQLVQGDTIAEIPLDLAPTGRPALDERAEISDSMSQALMRTVSREQAALLDSTEVGVTLLQATTRRFANASRLSLSVRFMNRGRYPIHTGQIVIRLAAAGVLAAPNETPDETIPSMSTTSPTLVFDLPTSATSAVIRTAFGAETAEFPLKLE
jgi:hypothetical protein